MLTRAKRMVAAAASLACLAGCGSHAATTHQRATAADREAVRLLPCAETIGSDAPWPGLRIVLGIVGLPASPDTRRALQTSRTGSRDPAERLFAKEGLVVRAGAHFALIVPPRLRDRLSIGWGNADENHVGSIIRVTGCHGHRGQRWLDFAGGYLVHDRLCAPLIVEAGGIRRRVWIGIGTACPGELSPPQPTQS